MTLSFRFVTVVLFCFIGAAASAFEEFPKRPVSLEGRWVLNSAQSDDAEQLLMDRLERQRLEDRKRMERWLRRREPTGARPLPPIGEEGVEIPAATRDAMARVKRRREREEDLYRRMLGIARTLNIRQEGRSIEMRSSIETRRFTAGSESQVSMPEGQLADLKAGWEGQWFVVQRRARGGPRVTEKFRLLKTDQLEYQMAWSGDTELAGMKVNRIFDRAQGEPPVRDPDLGPVR